MGDYATTTDLIGRFPSSAELSWLTGDTAAGAPEEDDLDDALERAEAEINTALAVRYKTPVSGAATSTMNLLKRMTLDLAEVVLIRRGPGMADFKAQQWQDVLDFCDKLAKGDRILPGATTWTSTASRSPLADWSDSSRTVDDSYGRLFTRTSGARL